MLVLEGTEKAVLKIGDRYVKIVRANRNGKFEIAVTEDDSKESLDEIYHFGTVRESRLNMPKIA